MDEKVSVRKHWYCVGDVHLKEAQGAFLSFLDDRIQEDPAGLVLLGDIFEYWLETSQMLHWYAPVMQRLEMLRNAGWSIQAVPGNREIMGARYLQRAYSANMHWPYLRLQCGAKKIICTHGDRLCDDSSHQMFTAFMRSFWMKVIAQLLPQAAQNTIARFLRGASGSHKLKRYRKELNFSLPRLQALKNKGAQLLVLGHFHSPVRAQRGDFEIAILGDWHKNAGSWIEINAVGEAQHCTKEWLC